MISDEERREVVRRLRELRMTAPGVTSVGHGYLWSLLWAVFGEELGGVDRWDWFERMCSRLADLIDPGGNVPGEVCEIEGFGQGEPLPPIVDRDALLAVADELSEVRCDKRGELSITYGDLQGLARIIREALGETR